MDGAADGAALGELLDHAPAGVVTFADDGTITFANATLAEMLGYGHGELEGVRIESLMSVGARIFYQTHFFPLVRVHGRAEEIFLLLRAKEGAEVGVLVNAVRHQRGGQWANDCVFMQVRERRKFEEDLRRAVGGTVADVMTKKPKTIGPDATLEEAATVLHANDISRLPVVDVDGALLGILARGDIIRAMIADE